MLLTTDHLLALDALAASEAAGHALYTIAEDADTQNLFRVLELQGSGEKGISSDPRTFRK